MGDDAKRLFYQEVREKKQVSYGARHRSGRRGARGVSSVKFGTDIMRSKERREYVKAGEIRGYNYLNVTYREFLNKDRETQRDIVYRLCEAKNDFEIGLLWGLRDHHVKKIRQIYGVVRKRAGGILHMGPEHGIRDAKPPKLSVSVAPDGAITTVNKAEDTAPQEVVEASKVTLNRVYDGETASLRLMKLAEYIDSTARYRITLVLEELDTDA